MIDNLLLIQELLNHVFIGLEPYLPDILEIFSSFSGFKRVLLFQRDVSVFGQLCPSCDIGFDERGKLLRQHHHGFYRLY